MLLIGCEGDILLDSLTLTASEPVGMSSIEPIGSLGNWIQNEKQTNRRTKKQNDRIFDLQVQNLLHKH